MKKNGYTLRQVQDERDAYRQNRMLFECLQDDQARAGFYEDLEKSRFPVLRFKSFERKRGPAEWPSQDVYLLSARADVERALQAGSVQPYAHLDSGGKFMLGIDDPRRHAAQREVAERTLRGLKGHEIEACVREALVRAMLLPQNIGEFDLVREVALQAAVRFIALVFGLTARSHVHLEQAMYATYQRLTFQIIGRHFSAGDGLPSSGSERAKQFRQELEAFVDDAAAGKDFPEWWDKGLLQNDRSASVRLAAGYGDADETKVVILGLMAGTVGNITAAVANTIDHFFRTEDGMGGRLIDRASRAAREGDTAIVKQMVDEALLRRPPAPFLARTAAHAMKVGGYDIPAGAELLLALGADRTFDRDLMFGGAEDNHQFAHRCIGRHLAWPLVYETVRQVLALPGLAQVIDAATDAPMPLEKMWGSVCLSYPLRCQRDRRFNQQPLFLVLPIKDPVAENAFKLQELTRAGAPVVERALNDARNVHFAWFGLVENNTHLAMYTVYDGDFYAYVEHFALKVPLFDEQFKYLKGAPPTPVRLHPREFVEFIKEHNRQPLANYFYSAYPRLGVAEIFNEGVVRP